MSSRVARRIPYAAYLAYSATQKSPSVALCCSRFVDLLICHLLIFVYVCVSKRRDRDSRCLIKGPRPSDSSDLMVGGVGHSHGLELL